MASILKKFAFLLVIALFFIPLSARANDDHMALECSRMAAALISPDGDQLWQAFHEDPYENELSVADTVGFAPNGDILVGGRLMQSVTDYTMAVIRYDISGIELWSVYSATGALYDMDMAIDPSGGVILSTLLDDNFYTVRYDSAGQLSWSDSYFRGSFNDVASSSVVADSDGNTYLAGYLENRNILGVIRYGQTGQRDWVAQLEVSFNEDDNCYKEKRPIAAVGPSGNVYVSGFENEGGELLMVTARLAQDGTARWITRSSLFGNRTNIQHGFGPEAMVIDETGGVYIIALGQGINTAIFHYDAEGQEVWSHLDIAEKIQNPVGIGLTTEGDPIVGMSYQLMKFDQNGYPKWVTNQSAVKQTAFQMDALGNAAFTKGDFDSDYYDIPMDTIMYSFDSEKKVNWALDFEDGLIWWAMDSDAAGNLAIAGQKIVHEWHSDDYDDDYEEDDDDDNNDDNEDDEGCGCSTEGSNTGTTRTFLTLAMLLIGLMAWRLSRKRC